eukprot:scaffold25299_cov76-Amphora_coffeaeformis.AAC.1
MVAVAVDVDGRSDRGAGKWAVATLGGRTNVVSKVGSSEQGGKGLGGRWVWGRVLTASTTVSTVVYRKGSSAGVGWVKAMEKG